MMPSTLGATGSPWQGEIGSSKQRLTLFLLLQTYYNRAWCVLKDRAKILVGLPIGREDRVLFNAFRRYGPLMLRHMLANFRLLWSVCPRRDSQRYEQGIFVAVAIKK